MRTSAPDAPHAIAVARTLLVGSGSAVVAAYWLARVDGLVGVEEGTARWPQTVTGRPGT